MYIHLKANTKALWLFDYLKNTCSCRNARGSGETWSWYRHLWRRSPNQEQPREHLTEPQEHQNQVEYHTPHRASRTSEPGTVLHTSQSLKNIRIRYSIVHLTEPQNIRTSYSISYLIEPEEHQNLVQYYTPHRTSRTSEPGTVLYTSQSLKNIRTRYSIIHLTEPQEHQNQVLYYTPYRASRTSEPGTVLSTSQSLKNIRTRYSIIHLTEPEEHQNQVQYLTPHRASTSEPGTVFNTSQSLNIRTTYSYKEWVHNRTVQISLLANRPWCRPRWPISYYRTTTKW